MEPGQPCASTSPSANLVTDRLDPRRFPDRSPSRRDGGRQSLLEPSLSVSARPDGVVVLVGELDMDTLPEARQRVDEFMVPGRAVVLDIAGITFLDSMTLHWLVELADATGEPVIVRHATDAARVVLGIAAFLGSDSGAWVLDQTERPAPA